MAKILLLDPLGCRPDSNKHIHLLRDWSAAYILGYVPFPPLDLMYAAGYLRKKGFEAKIIEASIKHIRHPELVKMVVRENPDYVALSTTHFSVEEDKWLARLIKDSLARVKIIFGGPPVISDPAIALDDGSVDFVALGELELPLENIMQGKYDENVAYKQNGKIFQGVRRLVDMKELAIPARDLIDNQAYRYAIFNRRNPVTAMSTSRGCPHSKCRFCTSWLYTLREMRYRDFDSIKEELNEIVYKYKIGEIFFRDQVCTSNRELTWKMCEYIISNKIDISWRSSTRVDLVDKELLTLMRRAGCYQISFGFESSSQQSLDIANKGITIAQSRQAAKWAKEAQMEVLGLFMYGMLGDSIQTIKDLYNFALELGVDYAQFNTTYLMPGTDFYDEFQKSNSNFPSQELVKRTARNSFLRFYLRPAYLFKQFKKIKTMEDLVFLVKTGFSAVTSYL